MNLLSTEYSLKNKTLELYLSGCLNPHCINCHNPESWNFDSGIKIDYCISDIINKINQFDHLIDNIWILGGEPLNQVKDDLIWLLDRLKETNKNIWVWTRYEFNEIDLDILEYCDYVKYGKYIDNNSSYMTEYGFKLASSNQKIIKL